MEPELTSGRAPGVYLRYNPDPYMPHPRRPQSSRGPGCGKQPSSPTRLSAEHDRLPHQGQRQRLLAAVRAGRLEA